MFSLIIVVISIALVAVLAYATIWYGGKVYTDGGSQVEASRVINEGQQLDGAIKAYQTDHTGTLPSSITDLVSAGYLNSPLSGKWEFSTDYVVTLVDDRKACVEANQRLGNVFPAEPADFVPSCSWTEKDFPDKDRTLYGKTICCLD